MEVGTAPRRRSTAACTRLSRQSFPEGENRELLFKSLTVQGNPAESSLANLRTAKQVADLYLIQVANRTWRRILDGREGEREVESS